MYIVCLVCRFLIGGYGQAISVGLKNRWDWRLAIFVQNRKLCDLHRSHPPAHSLSRQYAPTNPTYHRPPHRTYPNPSPPSPSVQNHKPHLPRASPRLPRLIRLSHHLPNLLPHHSNLTRSSPPKTSFPGAIGGRGAQVDPSGRDGPFWAILYVSFTFFCGEGRMGIGLFGG